MPKGEIDDRYRKGILIRGIMDGYEARIRCITVGILHVDPGSRNR
jgi:hypothetical protein